MSILVKKIFTFFKNVHRIFKIWFTSNQKGWNEIYSGKGSIQKIARLYERVSYEMFYRRSMYHRIILTMKDGATSLQELQ